MAFRGAAVSFQQLKLGDSQDTKFTVQPNTWTIVPFDRLYADTDGFFQPPTRFVIPQNCYFVRVQGSGVIAGDGVNTKVRQLVIKKNFTTLVPPTGWYHGNSPTTMNANTETTTDFSCNPHPFHVVPGDYIEMEAMFAAGGPIDILGATMSLEVLSDVPVIDPGAPTEPPPPPPPSVSEVNFTLTNDGAGMENASDRQVFSTLNLVASNEIRLTVKAHSTLGTKFNHVAIGKPTGVSANTVATPLDLVFPTGLDMGANGEAVSEWTPYVRAAGEGLVVAMDFGSTKGNTRYGSGDGVAFYKFNAATYQDAMPVMDGSQSGAVAHVSKIEVR